MPETLKYRPIQLQASLKFPVPSIFLLSSAAVTALSLLLSFGNQMNDFTDT